MAQSAAAIRPATIFEPVVALGASLGMSASRSFRHGQNEWRMAVGRRNWTFAGSQRGADRAAVMLTMITT
jgi:hypothetical protein